MTSNGWCSCLHLWMLGLQAHINLPTELHLQPVFILRQSSWRKRADTKPKKQHSAGGGEGVWTAVGLWAALLWQQWRHYRVCPVHCFLYSLLLNILLQQGDLQHLSPPQARLALERGDFICPGEWKVGVNLLEDSSPNSRVYLICLKPHSNWRSRLKLSPEPTIPTYKGQPCLATYAVTPPLLIWFSAPTNLRPPLPISCLSDTTLFPVKPLTSHCHLQN